MASNGIQIAALILAILGTVLAYFATSKSHSPKIYTKNFIFKMLIQKF